MISKIYRFILVALLMITISLCWVPSPSFSVNGEIDIFTQKSPYNGRGLNVPSDAFGPDEEVIVYASVFRKGRPVKEVLVTFKVNRPLNGVPDTIIQVSAKTNNSGIASINFRIPNQENVFGVWKVFGNVELEGMIIQDSLEFKAGWIVELLAVRTLDENLSSNTIFGLGGYVGIEITLRNIAMVTKEATICVNVFDELNTPINFLRIENFEVPPNEQIVRLYGKIYLPTSAYIGNATLRTSISNPYNNESYSPDVITPFFMYPSKQIYPHFHDVSTFIELSSSSYKIGQKLVAELHVQNEGTEPETFEVNLAFDSVVVQTIPFGTLSPYSQQKLTLEFDTSNLEEGVYRLSSNIPALENEADLTDNTFVLNVTLFKETVTTPSIHDIAITNVVPSATQVYKGETVEICVIVRNNGTETEHFNVTLFYNSTIMTVLLVDNLPPNRSVTLTYIWNTSSIDVGTYQLKAEASPIDEENLKNNVFIDGTIKIIQPQPQKYRPPWPLWLLLLIIGLLALLGLIAIAIALYRRRQKKKLEKAFYSGWHAWFYNYDLRRKQ